MAWARAWNKGRRSDVRIRLQFVSSAGDVRFKRVRSWRKACAYFPTNGKVSITPGAGTLTSAFVVIRYGVFVLALLLVSSAAQAQERPRVNMRPYFVPLTALYVGDATMTQISLAAGAKEINPLMPQTPGLNAAVQAGYAAAEMFAVNWIAQRSPKVGKGLALALIAVESFAVVHNIRTVQVQRAINRRGL